MKLSPHLVLAVACTIVLAACGPNPPAETSDADKQAQETLEAQQAAQQRELHEREAALDERERILDQREQQASSTPPPEVAPQSNQPDQTDQSPLPQPPIAAAPDSAPDASYQSFYDNLSPFGSWLQMADYGYVWQPNATVQNSDWRPYTQGHWAYTDQGWAWVSDEPFGWITYHYGRWMRTHTLGWVWVPGDQWAPAWVSWRYGQDYVGWAPLPPDARFNRSTGIQRFADQQYSLGAADYTFVPAADFGDDSMSTAALPPDENTPIYNDTDNITNIYYDSSSYAIICYGPDYDFIRAKARRHLPPPFRLTRGGFLADGGNGAHISGNTLQFNAPRVHAPTAASAPKAVRGRVEDTRLASPHASPPSHYASASFPVRQPQTGANSGAGMRIPSQFNPQPINGNQNAAAGMSIPTQLKPVPVAIDQSTNNAQAEPAAPNGMRIPSRMNPAQVSPEVEQQKAREIQALQLQRQQQEQEGRQSAQQIRQEQAAALEQKRQQQSEAAQQRQQQAQDRQQSTDQQPQQNDQRQQAAELQRQQADAAAQAQEAQRAEEARVARAAQEERAAQQRAEQEQAAQQRAAQQEEARAAAASARAAAEAAKQQSQPGTSPTTGGH